MTLLGQRQRPSSELFVDQGIRCLRVVGDVCRLNPVRMRGICIELEQLGVRAINECLGLSHCGFLVSGVLCYPIYRGCGNKSEKNVGAHGGKYISRGLSEVERLRPKVADIYTIAR